MTKFRITHIQRDRADDGGVRRGAVVITIAVVVTLGLLSTAISGELTSVIGVL